MIVSRETKQGFVKTLLELAPSAEAADRQLDQILGSVSYEHKFDYLRNALGITLPNGCDIREFAPDSEYKEGCFAMLNCIVGKK
ncbi:MAG: hypothetical protein FWD96_00045 [Defluviitaleaceae bacterium]|nr:hypothetical protein [Defluviitaleaceae bacterium]